MGACHVHIFITMPLTTGHLSSSNMIVLSRLPSFITALSPPSSRNAVQTDRLSSINKFMNFSMKGSENALIFSLMTSDVI